jgi:hypothetical protein
MPMTDSEDALAAFWAKDEPPARDAAFETAVMARVSREALIQDAVDVLAVGAPAGAILWAAWPSLVGLAPSTLHLLTISAPALICAAALGLVVWSTREVLIRQGL